MVEQQSAKKPTPQEKAKDKSKKKINQELQKIDTVIGLNQAFGSIKTYDEFLKQAEIMYKAYGIEFKKEKFEVLKKPDGDNKKNPGLPGKQDVPKAV